MSFIKKFGIKEKINLLKDFFYEFIFVRRSLQALGISLVFSFYIIQTSVPQFSVTSTLRDTGAESPKGNVLGGSQLFVGGGTAMGGIYETFETNMHSYVLAQRLWDKGWGSKIYGTGEIDPEYFNKILKNHTFSKRIAAYLLGYDLYEFYSAHDLHSYIKGNYILNSRRGSNNITVKTLKSNKDFAIKFMNVLILETDNYAKESLIEKSKEIIEATYKQLAASRNSSIASALGSTINSEYFKIASLENDMPYHITIIDPPHSSEYPVAPNIASIILSNAIIFIFISIFFSFIQRNKEDLW